MHHIVGNSTFHACIFRLPVIFNAYRKDTHCVNEPKQAYMWIPLALFHRNSLCCVILDEVNSLISFLDNCLPLSDYTSLFQTLTPAQGIVHPKMKILSLITHWLLTLPMSLLRFWVWELFSCIVVYGGFRKLLDFIKYLNFCSEYEQSSWNDMSVSN